MLYKRIISIMVVFAMLTSISGINIFDFKPAGNIVYAAENNIDKKNVNVPVLSGAVPFYSILRQAPELNGMTVRYGEEDGLAPFVVEKGGRECWRTSIEKQNKNIYFKVDDSMKIGIENDIEIEVEYFDEGNGKFTILYDSTYNYTSNPVKEASTFVQLTNSKTWKKYKFIINDAKLTGTYKGYDFCLTVSAGNMKASKEDVYIGSVSVKRIAPQNPLHFYVDSSRVGNVFGTGEDIRLNLNISNKLGTMKEVGIRYVVVDNHDRKFAEKKLKVRIDPFQTKTEVLNIPVKEYGTYVLKVDVDDAGTVKSKDFPFSRILTEGEPDGSDYFGAITHFAQYKGEPEKNLSLAAMGGMQLIRDDMSWDQFEKVKGQYTILPEWDTYVEKAVEKGIQPLVILGGVNNPYYNNGYKGGCPVSDEAIAAYANYAREIAARYKGKVKYFEIWNEHNAIGSKYFNPNRATAEDYTRMLKAAYEAIKEVNPDAIVVGGGMAGTELEWIETILKEGGFDSMDAISIHPYCYPFAPEGLTDRVESIRTLFKKYGVEKPIWVTELGWPTYAGGDMRGAPESLAADYTVRSLTLGLSLGLDKVFVYDFQNDGVVATNREHNFGMIRGWYGEEVPWAAKESFVAFSAITHKLSGFKFVEKYKPSENVNAYRFHRDSDNKDMILMWAESGAETIGIKMDGSTCDVTDVYGNATNITPVNGVLNVTATGSPIYIEGAFKSEAGNPVFTTPTLTAQSLSIQAVVGQAFPMAFKVEDKNAPAIVNKGIKLPEGWQVIDRKEKDGATQIQVLVPDSAEAKSYNIPVYPVGENDEKIGYFNTKVQLVDKVSVTAVPELVQCGQWNNWKIKVTAKNNSYEDTYSGTLTVTGPEQWAAETAPLVISNLGPGKTQEFEMPVSYLEKQDTAVLDMKVDIGDGSPKTYKFKENLYAAVWTDTAPQIDGVISEGEWSDAMPLAFNREDQFRPTNTANQWGGTDDLSALSYYKWDNKNLYFAMKVKDNVHFQDETNSNMWRGDCVQMHIDMNKFDKESIFGETEMGMNLNMKTGKVTFYRMTPMVGKTEGTMPGEVMIKRNNEEGTTTYEVAISWTEVLPDVMKAEPGKIVGTAIVLNDNDGSGRRAWMQYGEGFLSIDRTMFADLLLVKR